MVDPSFSGFQSLPFPDLDRALSVPTDRRLFAVGKALMEDNYTVDEIHELTKIDRWFLHKLDNIYQNRLALQKLSSQADTLDASYIPEELLIKSKKLGFSDNQIAALVGSTEPAVRFHRKQLGITPFVKKIDTLAAEFPADTNYLYTTYNASTHDVTFEDKGVMVLGSGVY
ncbi:carbamoyl-phosphate synthase (glutamine-hydrolyzing) cpa2, partial [Rhizoclosmatium hyalinum]